MGVFLRVIYHRPGRFSDAVYSPGRLGVIPTYLTELVPADTRAVLPGFVYQLGNLIASVNATL
ncbi:major facilitator transporter [Erwinia tracheiphila PSU-1]|nr:major facilitator transporter [Erwinia tracheiphila PSU-1]